MSARARAGPDARALAHAGHGDGVAHRVHDVDRVSARDVRPEPDAHPGVECLAQAERLGGEVRVRERAVGDRRARLCEAGERRRGEEGAVRLDGARGQKVVLWGESGEGGRERM